MLTVEYLLDLDIKHETAIQPPIIMRGDSAVLKFRVHDNNSNESLKTFDSAEVTLVMPSGIEIVENCIKQNIDNVDIARFEFQKIHSIEVGTYQIYLTIIQGGERVSVPPFAIEVDDNVSKDDYEFMEIINGLEDQLLELQEAINKGVALDSINVADGVTGLDSMKKIPKALLLDYFNEHIATSMYKDGAHGFRINETTKRPEVLINGEWKEAKYSETPMGAGSPLPVPTITVKNGYALVSFSEPTTLTLRKWSFGIQTKSWFTTNGNAISTNTFAVNKAGDHTFYYQLPDGRDNIVVFNVTQKDLETGTSKPIEAFNNGDIIKFGNMEWIVLDSAKGKLLSLFPLTSKAFDSSGSNKMFSPSDTSNIGYYLNSTFYNTFSTFEKSKIKISTWSVGAENNESLKTVQCPVGLLAYSDGNKYNSILNQYTNWNDSHIDIKGFSTLTENSSNSSEVWTMRIEDGEWSFDLTAKSSPILVRPSINLLEGSMVEPITRDENTPLSQFQDGDLIKFSDKRWRILDKEKGLIIYDDIPIYRSMNNVWDDFLNGVFYLSLSGQAKSFIQSNDWDLSKTTEIPMSTRVTAYVGLLSQKMFTDYKENQLQFLKNTKRLWSSTNGQNQETHVSIQTTESSFGAFLSLSSDLDYLIVPVLKVSQNATFGKLKKEEIALSDVSKGEIVWLGNYPWIKGNNNDLILNYNYKWDIEPKKVPFSGQDSSNYFINILDRTTTVNASQDVNSKFVFGRLFEKVFNILTEKEFNIGYAENPSAQKGFFKAGMINTNTWTNDYQQNLTRLELQEDFWLMNPLDQDTAYYVSAMNRQALTTSSVTTEKITKPVLRLDDDFQVQLYPIDTDNFANIPDPVVRKTINILLGKGHIEDQITIDEIESITFYDATQLGGATDLTGLELMKNCNEIRIAQPNPFTLNDLSPLIQLGKSKLLNSFSIYGVPEGDPSLAVYNQLKGELPSLVSGGIYTSGHQKVLISLAELKGVPEGIYLNLESFNSSVYNNEQGSYVGTLLSLGISAYGKTPITQIKPWNSSTYISIGQPVWELQLEDYVSNGWAVIPALNTGTDTTLYTIGFKDSDGNEELFYYKVDSNYNYFWSEKEKQPILSGTRAQGLLQTSVTLPTAVDGLTIIGFGTMLERPFWSANNVVTLNIPASYKFIGQVFNAGTKLEKIYVYNDAIDYLDKAYVFGKSVGAPEVTLYGRQNSATYNLHQFKISSENNVPQGIKNKYKFQLLP